MNKSYELIWAKKENNKKRQPITIKTILCVTQRGHGSKLNCACIALLDQPK